ncbi:MAG TPA: hypothetical protein VNO81_11450 [Candidatus Nitrosotenuis sp.]|nr:hypothetical protein [Candidatus Nitrosotenuis sp.]
MSQIGLLGQLADTLSVQGRADEALEIYRALLEGLEAEPRPDPFFASKAVLGLILAHIRCGQPAEAWRVWLSQPGDGLIGQAVAGLRDGAVSPHDRLLFCLAGAWLHSLRPDFAGAGETVNSLMRQAVEVARPEQMPLCLSHWVRCLESLFGTAVPPWMARDFLDARARYGKSFHLMELDFPEPAPWQPGHQQPQDGDLSTVSAS